MFKILLYYKYSPILNPQEFCENHKKLCEKLKLKGRIIIAKEGINGTVEGLIEDTNEYIKFFRALDEFSDMDFKISDGTGNAFPKLSIKVRNEIVSLHLGENDFSPNTTTGKYITAEELHDLIQSDEEFYIVDMRNDYEFEVGHFANSILPKLSNFRDLSKILPELETLKNKKVITVCTGGVRCEKASGLLVKSGFSDVYQLQNGIVTYMEKYPNEDFLGQLYVFDGRITMGFNLDDKNRIIVGKCKKCGKSSEIYTNCANLSCHKHFICCDDCVSSDGKKYCNECTPEFSVESEAATIFQKEN
jgi:UPF0176 protein